MNSPKAAISAAPAATAVRGVLRRPAITAETLAAIAPGVSSRPAAAASASPGRDVDDKQRAPAEGVDEHTADARPHGGGERAGRAPQRHRCLAALRRRVAEEDRQRGGDHRGGKGALDRASDE